MLQLQKKNKLRLQLITKFALIFLAVLLAIVLLVSIWGWLAMFWMPEQSYQGQLPPLQAEEITLQNSLQQDVNQLAAEIGIRNVSKYDQLNQAKDFLETSLAEAGYEVRLQEYKIGGKLYYNIEAEHTGTGKPDEIIVVGGHYDSAFTSFGANDNATGAAATLELARFFYNKKTTRTIRFVEFTNEELPFAGTEDMGSLVYAKQLRQRDEKIVAMLSLETMGYFSDKVGSQTYPFPINLFYPNQGNFIGFVANLESGDLLRKAIASFRRHTKFPSEGASLPDWIPGVSWSDHWSFWQQGYQGIMVTDTAPYRYPYYHTEQDTPDKIDFDKLARIVSGLAKVVSNLAE